MARTPAPVWEALPLVSRQQFALPVAPGQGMAPYDVPVHVLVGQVHRPRVVVTAGIHGDEFEGIRAVGRLLHALDPAALAGTVVLVPVAHPPAHVARTRVSPLDGADLNRIFPGDPNGSPTARLAATLMHALVEGADFLIDLHSGGTYTQFAPMVGFRVEPNGIAAASYAAATVFGLPWLWQMSSDAGVFTYEAARRGVPGLGVEAGGRGGCRAEDVETMYTGVCNVLRYLDMLSGHVPAPILPLPTYRGDWTLSPATGQWESVVALGDTVVAGQRLAAILSVDGEKIATVDARESGFVGAIRTFCAVNAGDWAVTVFTQCHDFVIAPGLTELPEG